MYDLINLGLVIGTKLGFVWWCLLSIALIALFIFKRMRAGTRRLLGRVLSLIEQLFRATNLVPSVASGNQGLPVQLEIFEQNLTTRIRSFLSQIGNLFKIQR